jgi:hypothetical protein
MRPIVVKLKIQDGQLVQDCDEYIGRRLTMAGHKRKDSIWSNPFTTKQYSLDECLRLYEEHFKKTIKSDFGLWIPRLAALEGKTLGCWCHKKPQVGKPLKRTCHGDIIADYVEILCTLLNSDDPSDEKMDAFLALF